MNAKRKLLIGGVYLRRGALKHAGLSMVGVCNEFEPLLLKHGYLNHAPFETVSLVFRFADADNFEPDIGTINSKHSELPVSISFNLDRLRNMTSIELQNEFRNATLETLCDVAANFDLPYNFLDDLRTSASGAKIQAAQPNRTENG